MKALSIAGVSIAKDKGHVQVSDKRFLKKLEAAGEQS